MWKWLIPGVLAGGPHPDPYGDPAQLAAFIGALGRDRFGAVVSALELPLRLPDSSSLEYLHAVTDDGEAPDDLEAICQLIDAQRMRGRATFVHCMAGHGRTGTVLAAYLIWSQHKPAAEAIDDVRALYHPEAVETARQRTALDAFSRRHRLL